ncbi:hypothetical protein AB9P05_13495 [Roseivirga sp. BDSF3-8]|uniref:hypothetical protein n=1 Tax=Roseivirga sp. BDSF3-8 TaxID=3241598 RepID=UPI0035324B52
MKYLSAILFILFTWQTGNCQQLQIGSGMVLAENEYYPATAQIDSVIVFRRNYHGGKQLVPFLRYISPAIGHFTFSGGVSYYANHAGLSAYKIIDSSTRSGIKTTTIGIKSLEVPLMVNYSLFPESDLTLKIFAGVIPVFSHINFDPVYKGDNSSIDFPQKVADVLNKAGTLPKRYYTDYQYGANISYKRFGLDVFIQQNLTSNINNNLKIWDQEALFTRKNETLRLLLSYTLPLGN